MSELPISREDLKKLQDLAGTEAGRQLLSYLRRTSAAELRSAVAQAAAGNYGEAGRIARGMISSPEAKALLEQLRRDSGGKF